MKAEASPMSVAEYCRQMIDGIITVNRDYQREEKIWGPFVRSYFIESILLEYPIPKIFLYVKFDLRTRASAKEIVDGQQRSHALRLFYENKMQLSSKIATEEFRGKKYRSLDPEWQAKFLKYSLPIDEFRGVDDDEIRESFTRMNVHNISLNPEEVRHARFQGVFKKFVLQLAKGFREKLLDAGVLTRRDVVRMADCRMIADIAAILEYGCTTTKAEDIDQLYAKYDEEFGNETVFRERITAAINQWYDLRIFDYRELDSKHVFYTIIAALIELEHPGAVTEKLDNDQKETFDRIVRREFSLQDLNDDIATAKAAKASDEGVELRFANFVNACSAKTNVAEEKLVRFAHLFRALD